MREFIKLDDIPKRLSVSFIGNIFSGYTQMFLYDKARQNGLNIISFCNDGIIVEAIVKIKGFSDNEYDKV